ncbi:putative MFS family arabinose efflux permease [Trinickia symbiotica]|uniref:MFS transporter n=1 Tax=Trinickia symbiotica TaxID=863227 RepID=A0A2N7WL22_9BURK|nr:MFS transporter [Trinickia symbiotica]PMS30159.1 MFS transporter [Trinickia symbiotica]PPK41169.1 putative MFS family arabinose efflux permease [Trinickia symbiotica]
MTQNISSSVGNESRGQAASWPGSEPSASTGARLRRTIFGAVVGNLLEQYDFALYGSMAAIALGTLFFSNLGPTAALFAGLSTFAIGFCARPVGGILAGHFGDIYGRKIVLMVTLIVAGIATAMIGVLPTYATAGLWAPFALVGLRLVQGVAVGGETSGAFLIVNESAPTAKRGLYTSLVTASSSAGVLLANFAILLFAAMPRDEFLSWGWRIPFLFAVVLIGIGAWIRRHMQESVAFEEAVGVEEARERKKSPLFEMLRHRRQLFQVMGLCMGYNALTYVSLTWVMGYLSLNGRATDLGLTGMVIAVSGFGAMAALSGYLSDKFGRRTLITLGSLGHILFAFPLFRLLDIGQAHAIWTAMGVAGLFSGTIAGPMNSLMVESFRTDHRYSASSSSYTIGAAVGGGLTPLLATLLYSQARATWGVSMIVVVAGLICISSARSLKETAGIDIQ